jgi:hypothetical protein
MKLNKTKMWHFIHKITKRFSPLYFTIYEASTLRSYSLASIVFIIKTQKPKKPKRSITMGLTMDRSPASTTPAYKYKGIRRIARNIFVIQATLRKNKLWKISKNMVVVRIQEELSLINAVRLNREGEELLQSLGFVARVIRLGTSTAGVEDDRHYRHFHGAQIWAPGTSANYQIPLDRIITEDTLLPFAHSKVFIFKNSVQPEAAILIQPGGKNKSKSGLLITSEALQDQKDNELMSVSVRTAMKISGMLDSKIVVPTKWLKSHQDKLPLRQDFERLLRLDFNKLIGSTGAIVPARAKEETVLAIEMAFPVW